MRASPDKGIPKRLGKEPLVEAAWELRFDGGGAAGSALPGILYAKYLQDNAKLTMDVLPIAGIPAAVRSAEPALRHMPTHALAFDNHVIFVGDRVAALNVGVPYPGWPGYKNSVRQLASSLEESGLVERPLQFSLRYTDFFEGGGGLLESLRLQVKVGEWEPSPEGFQLQMGIKQEGFSGAVQISYPAQKTAKDGTAVNGLVTNVQVTWAAADGSAFWTLYEPALDSAKRVCHDVFFGLLTREAIQSLEPVYEG